MADLEFVAFDIETTGFNIDHEVTVAGFSLPLGCRVFVQAPGENAPGTVEESVQERTNTNVNLSVYPSEVELLRAVGEFAGNRFRDDDVLLVAYNGELWNGGFDLPFLRTRLATTGVKWPFRDMPYADLLPVVKRRFNLTVDGEQRSSLPAAYEALVDGDLNAADPFSDSQEAVTAFKTGALDDLITHNLVDILRTEAIGQVTRRYCSKSDYDLKSLTPTIHDT